jgi:hypothetical protein
MRFIFEQVRVNTDFRDEGDDPCHYPRRTMVLLRRLRGCFKNILACRAPGSDIWVWTANPIPVI